jgi:hypothetical protein
MWHAKFVHASDGTPQIRGVTFAHLSPALQMVVLALIAASRVKFIDPTMEQLAAIGGVSVNKLREKRRQVGAPIRSKRASVRKADAAQPSHPAPEPANIDIIDALRRIGSSGFLKIAEMIERDELARAAAAAKTDGNGAALNGGAPHYGI